MPFDYGESAAMQGQARARSPIWGGLLLVLVIVMAGFLVFQTMMESRRAAERHAELTSSNLARLLATEIEGTINRTDTLLRSAVQEIARQQARGGIDRDVLDTFLTEQQSLSEQIISLRVTDATGIVRYGPGVRSAPMTDLSDRIFFTRQRDEPAFGLMISPPVLARISKQWVVTLSRRVTNPDGSFGGVVYANVALEYLAKEFRNINTGPQGVVQLFDANRNIMARYPEPKGPGTAVGIQVTSPEITALMSEGRTEATYRAKGSIDGIYRTLSYRKLANHALFAQIGLAEDDYLAEWRVQRRLQVMLYAAFCIVVVGISGLLLRAWWRAGATLDKLAEAQAAGAQTMAALRSANTEYRAVAARLRLVLETAAEGIIGLDDEARIMFANPEAAAILAFASAEVLQGMASGDALGHRLADGRPCAEGDCGVRRTIADGQTRSVEDEFFTTTTGQTVPVEYVVAPLVVEGEIVGAVLVFRDIRRRKAMEADLQRSNAELQQFAYVASHDLRQPLRMVCSYLGLIERRLGERMDAELKEFMDFATSGAMRMDRLILDLLEYSRIGRQDVDVVAVPLGEAVAESLANLQVAIGEAGANVIVADNLPTVNGHRTELTRLFQNLIGNAVKYRAADRPSRIEVGCRVDGRNWLVWIKDNGIGIPADCSERVFAVFQRLVRDDQYEGTGIGLAVCRKIVEHHGGRIWVEGDEGKGSTFFFTLPADR
jgi:PAS domain S-box-containing protein